MPNVYISGHGNQVDCGWKISLTIEMIDTCYRETENHRTK